MLFLVCCNLCGGNEVGFQEEGSKLDRKEKKVTYACTMIVVGLVRRDGKYLLHKNCPTNTNRPWGLRLE